MASRKMLPMTEEWREVAGTDGMYEASSLGAIRSWVSRGKPGVRASKPRVLKASPNVHGYPRVGLFIGGAVKYHQVHALVCAAFHGQRPAGMEARHFPDGTKTNCSAANLAWGTPKENSQDKAMHGTIRRGESAPNSKLTEADVVDIRLRRAAGEKLDDIAADKGVTFSLVSQVARRVIWAHVA